MDSKYMFEGLFAFFTIIISCRERRGGEGGDLQLLYLFKSKSTHVCM